jgi:hypothetical protein
MEVFRVCALCGVLGADDHWTSAVSRPGVYTRNEDRVSRRREAAKRLKIANAVLQTRRLDLREWQGGTYILSNATGGTRVFQSLAHMWPEAEAMVSSGFDPLDAGFLQKIEEIAR